MKLNGDSGGNQEKKQVRKELFKWSRQITEYCAFESFVKYLLPADTFKSFDKNYQEYCEKLKESEMFECNGTVVDEELLLSECNRQQHELYEDNDENYLNGENQSIEEPLDLSNKNNNRLLIEKSVEVKSIPAAGSSTRRNYSKEELDRALADIQSGRIGTRRASVLYGIPRSTLRNKVFRLNNQKQQLPKIDATRKQNENESKFYELKEKLINNLSLNFAYQKLLTPSDALLNEQLKDNLIKYSTHAPIQQYISNTMLKILNEVVNEKISVENSKKNEQPKEQKLNLQQQLSLKQKRAKRGQYRKYESNQLTKAVEAVIQGIMSVHKAGSHFGVPHSTLEYKVKERNMRASSNKQASVASPPPSEKNKIKQTVTNGKLNEVYTSQTKSTAATSSVLASNFFSASDLLKRLYESSNGAKY